MANNVIAYHVTSKSCSLLYKDGHYYNQMFTSMCIVCCEHVCIVHAHVCVCVHVSMLMHIYTCISVCIHAYNMNTGVQMVSHTHTITTTTLDIFIQSHTDKIL